MNRPKTICFGDRSKERGMQEQNKEGPGRALQEILRGERKINKENLVVILLVGVLLFVIMLPTKNSNSSLISYTEETEEKVDFTKQEELENRLTKFLAEIEGVGRVSVLMHMEEESVSSYGSNSSINKITGVIVAAEGASNETIRLEIVKMVMALYDLSADKVEVYPLKRE